MSVAARSRLVRIVLLVLPLALLSASRPAAAAWRSEGPFLGSVKDLAIDPSRPDTVYAAVRNGGVWRSDDFGRTWTLPGSDLVGWPLEWVEVDRSAPATLWAGVDTPGQPALWRSLDRGVSWKLLDGGYTGGVGRIHPTGVRIAFAPSRPADIWVPSTNLHYRSRDGGKSWTDFRVPNQDAYAIAVDPRDPNVVWAGGSGESLHLSRSDDGGKSWKPIGRGIERNGIDAILVDPAQPSTVWVVSGFADVWKSTDRGETFTRSPLPTGGTDDLFRMVMDPTNPEVLWATTEKGLLRTTDGGESWNLSDHGTGRYLVNSVALDPRDSRRMLAATDGGGIYRSEDGGDGWAESSSGLAAGWVEAIWAAPGAAAVFAQTSGLQRRDASGAWSELVAPFEDDGDEAEPDGVLFERGSPQSLWLFDYARAWRSSDGGARWQELEQKEPSLREMMKGSLESAQFRSLAQDGGDPKVFYAGSVSNDEPGKAIFKSTDGGKSWKPAGTGVPAGAVELLRTGAAGEVHALVDGNGLWRTTDGGKSWSRSGAGLPEKVRDLAVDAATPSRLYAASEQGLFRSTDGGATFAKLGGALAEEDVEAVEVAPDGRAFAASFHGVFVSRDGGGSWTAINDGLTQTDVRALAIGGSPIRLWAGTAGGSVWSAELP